jgi:hypothetical protein
MNPRRGRKIENNAAIEKDSDYNFNFCILFEPSGNELQVQEFERA